MSATLFQELQLSLGPSKSKTLTLALKITPTINREEKNENRDEDSLYVHPLIKRSSAATLSEKSLDMCTETLGSETGTDISGYSTLSSDGYSSSSDSEWEKSPVKERPSIGNVLKSKKSPSRSFPPPLKSASGATGVQILPHREGGRLVMKAVTIVPSQSLLQAERSDGRLKLRFVEDYDEPLEHDYEEDDITVESQEPEDSHGYMAECEIEIRDIQRLGRCYEERPKVDEMLRWEPFWVAT